MNYNEYYAEFSKNNKIGFNFFRLFILTFGIIGVGFGIYALVLREIIGLVIILIFGGTSAIFLIFLSKQQDETNYKKIQMAEIIEKGKKVNGVILEKICKVKRDYINGSRTGKKHYYYYAVIKYIDPDTGKEIKFKTPQLNFNVKNDLIDDNVEIFYWKNKHIVSKFNLNPIVKYENILIIIDVLYAFFILYFTAFIFEVEDIKVRKIALIGELIGLVILLLCNKRLKKKI